MWKTVRVPGDWDSTFCSALWSNTRQPAHNKRESRFWLLVEDTVHLCRRLLEQSTLVALGAWNCFFSLGQIRKQRERLNRREARLPILRSSVPGPTSSNSKPPLKNPVTYQNTTPSWRSNIPTHELVGYFSHLYHNESKKEKIRKIIMHFLQSTLTLENTNE